MNFIQAPRMPATASLRIPAAAGLPSLASLPLLTHLINAINSLTHQSQVARGAVGAL